MIGPRRKTADYWIPNGTRYESHLRRIHGVEYRFIKISHIDGSVTVMAESIGWDQPAWHMWTITPDGRLV